MDNTPIAAEATRPDPRRPGTPPGALSGDGWSARVEPRGIVVTLAGDWIVTATNRVGTIGPTSVFDAASDGELFFDSGPLGRWDSSLLIWLSTLRLAARQRGVSFHDDGLPPAAARLLALTSAEQASDVAAPAKTGLFRRVGDSVIGGWREAGEVSALVGDTVLSGGSAVRGRLRMRGADLITCMYDAGAAALPIVTIVNALIGGIVAFVGAVQLSRFGADIFIADLVCVAMAREMAPLMTGIIMSGRTGGAYAAHIATMVGNEEIDALHAIGIPVYDYLILPRILALACMMPLLYVYGCAVGIFGGFIVAVSMLNLAPNAFFNEATLALGSNQILFGLVKSFAFGVMIAIVGCRAGLSAGRTASDVGRATTTAVVVGIVGVIALDAIFAVCANALDI